MKSVYTLFGVSLVTLFLFPGCGGGPGDMPDIGNVSGTVKVDGQPKSKLQVVFQPKDGRPSSGTTDDAGQYTLRYSQEEDGAKVGKGVFSINTPPPASDDCCGGGCGEGFVDPIPPRYNINAADNPDMQKEVKPGDNTFDFDIDTSIREEAPDCGGGASCCCG
jgi:hypothetical protein